MISAEHAGRIRFSIVIDNYNYASFLANAIDSCLRQTYPAFEIIVVDDGSTDGSREVLRGYEGVEGVRILLQENQGQAAALQHGFDSATGDWILGLDSDDYYRENCLEEIARRVDGSVDWIYFRASIVDVGGTRMGARPDPSVVMMQGETWVPWILEGHLHTFPPQSFHCRSSRFMRSVRLFPNRYVDQKTAIVPDRFLDIMSSFNCRAAAIDLELGCYRDHARGDSKVAHRNFPRIRSRLRQQILAEEIVAEKLREKGVQARPNFCAYSAYDYWPDRLISLVCDRAGHPHPGDSRIALFLRILGTYVNRRQIRLLGAARAACQYAAVALMPRKLAWSLYRLPATRKIYSQALTRLRGWAAGAHL
jgi:glycosyltransferase involved in cell wall biosynthesis